MQNTKSEIVKQTAYGNVSVKVRRLGGTKLELANPARSKNIEIIGTSKGKRNPEYAVVKANGKTYAVSAEALKNGNYSRPVIYFNVRGDGDRYRESVAEDFAHRYGAWLAGDVFRTEYVRGENKPYKGEIRYGKRSAAFEVYAEVEDFNQTLADLATKTGEREFWGS